MVITSQVPDRPKAAAVGVLLLAVMSLIVPATARSDIFKWTDAQGKVNISNVPPPASAASQDLELVLKESTSAPVAQRLATPTELALLARIDGLERQLQTRQYATQAPLTPPVSNGTYYPPVPPPPPAAGYYSSAYSGSYPAYYPNYTYPIASSYVVYPARAYYAQPVRLAPRAGYSHAGGGHGGHRGRR